MHIPFDRGDARGVEGDLDALRIVFVDPEDAEQRGLATNPPILVLEAPDRNRCSVAEQDVAMRAAFERQTADTVRGQLEAVGTVADPGDADRRPKRSD